MLITSEGSGWLDLDSDSVSVSSGIFTSFEVKEGGFEFSSFFETVLVGGGGGLEFDFGLSLLLGAWGFDPCFCKLAKSIAFFKTATQSSNTSPSSEQK